MGERMPQEEGLLHGADSAGRGDTTGPGDRLADDALPLFGGALARGESPPFKPGAGYYRFHPRFLQEFERGPWHVESLDDVERMLCGVVISVESSAKIQARWGLKPCVFCLNEFRRWAPDHPLAQ